MLAYIKDALRATLANLRKQGHIGCQEGQKCVLLPERTEIGS
ncbi:hypothetical protein [Sphingobacterium sp. LRF_L2]